MTLHTPTTLPATLAPGSRAMLSWQTMLADLALILFMVTAATAAPNPAQKAPPPPHAAPLPASPWGQPLAIWRATPHGPTIAAWLAGQAADPRQRLTILARFAPGTRAQALAEAGQLAEAAGPAGATARVAVEPASANAPAQVLALLSYDREAATPAAP